MSYALLIFLVCAVTARLTRFVTADSLPLMADLRDWLIKRIIGPLRPDGSYNRYRLRWAELMECPWCMSIWIGAAVTFVADLVYGVPAPVFVWLTASWVSGIVADYAPKDD